MRAYVAFVIAVVALALCCVGDVYGTPNQPIFEGVPVEVEKAMALTYERIAADASTDECDTCQFIVFAIDQLIQLNKTEDDIAFLVADYCTLFNVPKNYRDVRQLCDGLVNEFKSEVVKILTQKYVKPSRVCQTIHLCEKDEKYHEPLHIPTNNDEGVLFEGMDAPKWVERKKETLPSDVGLIYHISDIHTDNLYTEGAVIDCGLPLCCEYGQGQDPSNSSRKWGEYAECDVPPIFTTTTLAYMANLTEVDFFLWTGDNTPHDIWKQNVAEQLKRMQLVTNYVAAAFPTTQIWPAFGNHDTYPVDQFSFPPEIAWLMNNMSGQWSQWIPKESLDSFKYAGYYVAPIRPGLQMISLNTQWCDGNNFYLWLDVPDPGDQLSWLTNTLSVAKENNEKVYIIGHIPPNSMTLNCSIQYYQIINQFNETVAGQFFGHTHHDQFQIFRDEETNTIPSNFAYIAPSHTSYGGVNPSFRIYEYNRTSFEILDYTQFVTNLNDVNAQDKVTYYVEYSAKQAYSLPDMSPASWEGLVGRMSSNTTLFTQFYNRIYAGYPQGTCEGTCAQGWLCDLNNANARLENDCQDSIGFVDSRPHFC